MPHAPDRATARQALKSVPAEPRNARTPRPRDPVATQTRILAAATAEFARHGLGGARVDAIASRAKANKRMIYHYFNSKDDLFLAVLEEAYGSIRTAERRLDLENLDPLAAIIKLIGFTWTYYQQHPEFLRLISTENIHRAIHLKRSQRIAEMHSGFIALIQDLLDRGVRAGVFRRGVDAMQVYISIAALGYYFLSNRFTLSVIYGMDLSAPEALEERGRVIVDTILRYIRADDPDALRPR
jgi:AcrR family transcriptional regulator